MNRLYFFKHEANLKTTELVEPDPSLMGAKVTIQSNASTKNDSIPPELLSKMSGERIEHLHRTLKAKVGQEIKLVGLNLGLFRGQIINLDQQSVTIEITNEDASSSNKATHPRIELWIAACRPQTAKKILEGAVCFGIERIKFFNASLTEKSYLDAQLFLQKEFIHHLALGLSQSMSYFTIPEIEILPYLPKPLETSSTTLEEIPYYYLLSKEGSKSLHSPTIKKQLQKGPNHLQVFIFGPERGLTAEEELLFKNGGARAISLVHSTLRLENAVIAALALIHSAANA